MSSPQPILAARQLGFAYRGEIPVLTDIELDFFEGKLTCLLGPNGAGKTTLLKCLLGLFPPSAGRALLDNRPIESFSVLERAQMQAYVPQFPETSFAFSAGEIVLMGRYAHTGSLGITTVADRAVAKEAMKMTRTEDLSNRSLDELSGGEAGRVMIARALAQQPRVMLLDEPTSHLDLANQLVIYRMMRRVAHEWPMSVITVSHDINLAARYADRLVLLKEGRIVAEGSPAEVLTQDNLEATYDVSIEFVTDREGNRVVVGHENA